MKKISSDKIILKKFGTTMGTALLVITLFILIKHKYVALPVFIISMIFFISALTVPILLRPIYVFWMGLAHILAWINTRLILFVIFYIIFTPIGAGIRLFGIDLLDRKIDKNKGSYWLKKEQKESNSLDYEWQS